jgi:hypothetical protein
MDASSSGFDRLPLRRLSSRAGGELADSPDSISVFVNREHPATGFKYRLQQTSGGIKIGRHKRPPNLPGEPVYMWHPPFTFSS